jgi:hypothetical protein
VAITDPARDSAPSAFRGSAQHQNGVDQLFPAGAIFKAAAMISAFA